MQGILEWLTSIAQGVKFWAVICPWESGVRVRLGKHAAKLDSGWHWRIPLADSILIFNNRLRIAVVPAQTITTSDGRAVSVAGSVGFRIADPLRAMLALQQPELSAAALVQRTVAQYVAGRDLDEIAADELEACAKAELEVLADGLEIEYVKLTDFAIINRTFRLLGEEWRPSTKLDAHDHVKDE